MKQFSALQALVVAAVIAAGGLATMPAQAQEGGGDLVVFGPASNPGGLAGFIQVFETDPLEFHPAFLPAPINMPNIGVTLLELGGLELSDQLWVQNGAWYFASDPNLINFSQFGITEVGELFENGTLQDVSGYFGLPPNSMSVQSDIPEPSTFALVGLSAAVLATFRRRK